MIQFELFSSTKLNPVFKIVESKFKDLGNLSDVVGINTNAFLMAADGPLPQNWSYNLVMSNGVPFQLPTNIRPTLITKNGKLIFSTLDAKGKMTIGKNRISWVGSNTKGGVKSLTIYGTFNIPQTRSELKGKKVISSAYEAAWVKPNKNESLLGFKLEENGVFIEIVSKNKLNLFDYLFIGSGKSVYFDKIEVESFVTDIEIDGIKLGTGTSAHSLITQLSKNKSNIANFSKKFLVKSVISTELFLENYKKAWSVILENNDSVIFFLIDARPKVSGQEGLSIFELHKFLTSRFKFNKAFIADAGQSSRICYVGRSKRKIHGNLHYLNYKKDPMKWDGYNGRLVPGVLLAYNRST